MRRALAVLGIASSAAWAALASGQTPPAKPAPAPTAKTPAAPPAAPAPTTTTAPSAPPAPSPSPAAPASPAAPPSSAAPAPTTPPGSTTSQAPAPDAPPSTAPTTEPPPAAAPPPERPAEPAPAPPKPPKLEPSPPTKSDAASTSPALDKPDEEPNPFREGHALGIEAVARVGSRVGPSSYATTSEERAGLGYRFAGHFSLSPEYAIGFGLMRADLGRLTVTSGASSVNAEYSTTAIELGARAFPIRAKDVDLFVGLHVGLAWQHVDANGLTEPVGFTPGTVFACSDVAGPGFGLGAELGAGLLLTRSLMLTGALDVSGYRLSAEPVGSCVGGIGSTTLLSFGVGLLYAFDLGAEARLSGGPKAARR